MSIKSRIATLISVLSVLGIAAPVAGAAVTHTSAAVKTPIVRAGPVTTAYQAGLQAALGGWQAGEAAAQGGFQAGATAAQAGINAGLTALGLPVNGNVGLLLGL